MGRSGERGERRAEVMPAYGGFNNILM